MSNKSEELNVTSSQLSKWYVFDMETDLSDYEKVKAAIASAQDEICYATTWGNLSVKREVKREQCIDRDAEAVVRGSKTWDSMDIEVFYSDKNAEKVNKSIKLLEDMFESANDQRQFVLALDDKDESGNFTYIRGSFQVSQFSILVQKDESVKIGITIEPTNTDRLFMPSIDTKGE